MNGIRGWIAACTGTAAAWFGYLTGGVDAALGVMFVAMGLDIASGVLTALAGRSEKTADGRFRSRAVCAGITKKLMMLCVVMAATLTDRLAGTGGVCRTAAIAFYTANEAMSILENAGRVGVPLPKALRDAIGKLKGDS